MTFQDLQLLPALLRAVGDMGYVEPSPIQAAAIPPVLAGRDLIGCAQTGTGKTAAFAIPILQRLQKKADGSHKPIRALVLTPTRELALQIQDNFERYSKYLPLRSTVIFGGVGQMPQVEAIRKGVDVLVATPGRLNDLCNQGHIDLKKIETFVLDEADRMLDMGFIHDVRKVIARLPQRRQTLLFSATMPKEIADLSQQILHNPVRVEVTPQSSTVDAIEQQLYKVDKSKKRDLLLWLLGKRSEQTILVFTATKHGADRVVRELNRNNVPAMAIHGNKSQTNRVKALESFKDGSIRVLVATDIAARGIDISELPLVINFDLPNIPETYVHRIGRTGRAGHSGLAISFCNFDELAYLKDIEKLTQKTVPVVEDHPFPMEIFEPTPKVQRGPRPSKQQPRENKTVAAAGTSGESASQTGKQGSKRKKKAAQPPKSAAPKPEQKSLQVQMEHKPHHKPLPPEEPVQTGRPVKKLRSGAPELPGRVVAFADGRHRPRRRGNRGNGSRQSGEQ